MTIVFVSNYFNHHQKPFSEAMYALLGEDFRFIETSRMPKERVALGYSSEQGLEYLVSYGEFCEDREKCQGLIDDADVVIKGSCPFELMKNRIKNKKTVFYCSERPFKTKNELWKRPIRFFTWRKVYPQAKNRYMLCSSAFTSQDMSTLGLFSGQCYKWGYFPAVNRYGDIDELIDKKTPASLLWVGRFIDCKHPEAAIEVAKRLKQEGYDFTLNMIGRGELEESIQQLIEAEGLGDRVRLLGSMKPEEVREYMERSEIYLFTSDKQEGWGAVLNEAMNSGCGVVASHAIGSVPFLISNGNNGLIYKSGDIDSLYSKVKYLLDNPKEIKAIGKNAYLTMTETWNAENATKRLLGLIEALGKNRKAKPFEEGPCSKAKILRDNWFKEE